MADKRVDIVLEFQTKTSEAISGVKALDKALSSLQLPKGLDNLKTKGLDKIKDKLDELKKLGEVPLKGANLEKFEKTKVQLGVLIESMLADFKKISDKEVDGPIITNKAIIAMTELKAQIAELEKQAQKLNATDLSKVDAAFETLNRRIGIDEGSTKKIQGIITQFEEMRKVGEYTAEEMGSMQQEIEKVTIAYERNFNAKLKGKDLDSLTEKQIANLQVEKALREELIPIFTRTSEEADHLRVALAGVEAIGLAEADDKIKEITADAKEATSAILENANSFKKNSESIAEMDNQVSRVQQSLINFFSIAGGFRLLSKAVRNAVTTIKELDKVMTETAVVTEFDVGDMWKALPEYTKLANDLGATTKGAYETLTLFYQQGLDTNEVFAIGTETMKMARIAGLEYSRATDLMTAALRGFNMELTDVSAKRVNDVYSNLAAKTASTTEEIANAMTKTASIAHSAGMEFEVTSAFLAQMLETTRESSENLGTAMKTVIARFTELKKDPTGLIDVDGEEMNANRVEAALKSVGVALRDQSGEFRNLDDVFLELASKWDGLNVMQQRYVATMAAGSRQQSRFIAMMGDYERTMELVGFATDSSGASQKQFDKTLESVEAKVNKLKNAWNNFTMGLVNSTAVKVAIDGLTGLLTLANTATDSFGALASVVLKAGIALSVFSLGKKATTGGIKGLAGLPKVLKTTSTFVSSKEAFEMGQAAQKNFLEGFSQKGTEVTKSISNFGNLLKTKLAQLAGFLGTTGGVIIGAVVAAGVIIAIAKYYSLEQQLKRAQKAANELKKSLDEVRKESKDFTSGMESLGEATDDLNSLEKGSLEWKKALLEVNDVVDELIAKFPELAHYVSRNADGLKSFSDEGIRRMEEAYKKRQDAALAASTRADLDVLGIQENVARDQLNKARYETGMPGGRDGALQTKTLTQTQIDDLLQTEGDTEAIANLAGSISDVTVDFLQKTYDIYKDNLDRIALQQEVAVSNYLRGVLKPEGVEGGTKESTIDFLSESGSELYSNKFNEAKKDFVEKEVNELESLYRTVFGVWEIPEDIVGDKDKLVSALAENAVTKFYQSLAPKIEDTLEKALEGTENLTAEGLDDLLLSEQAVEDAISEGDLKEAAEALGISVDELIERIIILNQAGADLYADAAAKVDKYGTLGREAEKSSLNTEQLQGLGRGLD